MDEWYNALTGPYPGVKAEVSQEAHLQLLSVTLNSRVDKSVCGMHPV